MSEAPSPQAGEPAAPATGAEGPPAQPRAIPFWRQGAFWLALIALAAAGGALLETRSRLSATQEEVAKRLAAADTAAREGHVLSRQNQDLLLSLQGKIGALEARLAETESQRIALEGMYQELLRHRDDNRIAETEHGVRLAAQQIQLAGNFEAALIALQDIELRLSGSEDPALFPLRKALAHDIERLRAVAPVFAAGTALKLDAVIADADSMPLAFEAKPRAAAVRKAGRAPEQGFWASLGAEVWSEVSSLVRIERSDRPQPALMAPEHAFFLRENLKLRLLNARLALLQRDLRVFREDVRQARGWIERYFDPGSPQARSALAILGRLAEAQPPEPPSLAETLAALRALEAGRAAASAERR
ncbi:MAG: hypothetical protein OHK0026_10450 [Rhodocyclaceae bacterium]